MSRPYSTLSGLDEETRDMTPSERLNAALPFQRNPALTGAAMGAPSAYRVPDPTGNGVPFDITAHARLAARLVAAPHEAVEDLRLLGLQQPSARERADAAVVALLDADPAAAAVWNEAFERELARHG